MIRYALKCAENHRFESWFQSAEAFDSLAASGHLTCAICGSNKVTKDVMAPRVSASADAEAPAPTLTEPQSAEEKMLAAYKAHVEKTATYVGADFATQARAMHNGHTPEGAIYGEARLDEAKSLLEDGVPVAPLPFRPSNKSN